MTTTTTIFYLSIINTIAFLCMAIDKQQARKRRNRLSEYFFTLLSMLGGFVGIITGALIYHHKTRKRSFQLKILLGIIIFSIFATLLICHRFDKSMTYFFM